MERDNHLYAFYTETLHDILIDNPTLLDDLFDLGDTERTEKFKSAFVAMWDIYENGSETLEMFKINLTNTFNQYKKYYIDMLDVYENNLITLDDLINNSNVVENIDLPNSQTDSEYISSKIRTSYVDKTIMLDRRDKLLNSIRNIYNEFVYQFKECFSQIFYSFKVYKNGGFYE